MLTLTDDLRRDLIASAEALPGAVRAALARFDALQERVQDLAPTCCTGVEYWRDQDHPTRAPKLYINHATDQACPVHGQPKLAGRLRVYVGADPDAIQAAQAAIQRESKRQELAAQLDALEDTIALARWPIRRLLNDLDT
jgi:hypothetical protein